MASDIDAIARANLTKVLGNGAAPEDIDPDVDMEDYGLTSLEKILFLTATCEGTGVELSAFTERDLDRMRTLRDVIGAVGARADRTA
jgi:acyl carrier protein